MAKEIEKVNSIAFADIEKINGKTDANIENLNGFEFSAPSFGPPEFDAVSVNNASSGASTQTSSHAIGGSGVGRGLVVIIAQLNSGSAPADPTGVTYDGVAMTKQASKKDYERLRLTLWTLIAPATGTNNIVASFAATTDGPSAVRGISFTGLNQTSMWNLQNSGEYNLGSETSIGPVGIDTVAGQFAISAIAIAADGAASAPSSLVVHSGATSGSTLIGATANLYAGAYIEASGTTTDLGWSWSGGGNYAAIFGRVLSDVYS